MTNRHRALAEVLAGLTGAILLATAATGFAADTGSASAENQLQGIYSAAQLMDANVYTKGDSQNAIGEVKDVLLDNSMTVQSFVIQTDGTLGLAGKSYVVSPNQLRVQTLSSGQPRKPEYRINLDMTSSQLTQEPVYSNSWWNKAQANASAAWQQTKQSAFSAWTQVKSATKNIAHETANAAKKAGEQAKNAIHNATGN